MGRVAAVAVRGGLVGARRASFAGADLRAFAACEITAEPGHPGWGFAGLVERAIRKPLIVSVNGLALLGGTEIVQSCDLAIMSADVSLGLPPVKRGLFAAAAGLIRLPRRLPARLAVEYALTGRSTGADVASRYGAVDLVVPARELLGSALARAAEIVSNEPLAVRTGKRIIRAATGLGDDGDQDAYPLQRDAETTVFGNRDPRERASVRVEKRPAVWTGE